MSSTSVNMAWVLLPGGLVILCGIASAQLARRRATKRLFRKSKNEEEERLDMAPHTEEPWGSWLERWLFISGYRSGAAQARFLLIQGIAVVAAASLTLVVARSGLLSVGIQWLVEIPGGVGDFMAPVLTAAPWIIFLLISLLPVSRVRARRRDIVNKVERDLPIALALLATLVESGLGFDAAVERVLQSLNADRPLALELRTFRSESQSGVPRVVCFRRLANRLDVQSITTFVSALVHAENVGGGIAEGLRRQADDVWSRRRDIAIQRAQTLPTKLAVPLVICFLPGIFVYTLGPALAQFVDIASEVLNSGTE